MMAILLRPQFVKSSEYEFMLYTFALSPANGNIQLINLVTKQLHLLQIVGWNYMAILKLHGAAIYVWEWVNIFIPHFITDVITYPC